MVKAHDRAAIKWDLIYKIDKRFFNFSDTTMPWSRCSSSIFVTTPMVEQASKATIALIGFSNEISPAQAGHWMKWTSDDHR